MSERHQHFKSKKSWLSCCDNQLLYEQVYCEMVVTYEKATILTQQ